MCGRYAITLPPEAMQRAFRYRERPHFPARYNIAPTQPVPVVRLERGERQFILMRWGFIPGWVKDPKDFPLVVNIRSESAGEKPSFKAALARRRCLMPADGFYEWHRLGGGRDRENRPYLVTRVDRGFFGFAALWETWHSRDGSEIDTVALLTGPANGEIAALHERAPVIVPPEAFDAWLDPATEPGRVQALLRPPPDALLSLTRLGPAVNSVSNDGPQVQAPFQAEAAVPAAQDAQGRLL